MPIDDAMSQMLEKQFSDLSPEFKEKRERWMDARGRANPIDEGLKNIFKKSIEKGNGIMNKMFIDSFMFPPKLSQQF